MSEPKKNGGCLAEAWLVILLALLYGGGLAGVQTALSGRIAANKQNETRYVIPLLVEDADKDQTSEITVTGKDGKETTVYKAFESGGRHAGWVLPGGGQGFAGRIELLIGLNTSLTVITGLYVLDQKETPGLGDFITSEEFRLRFSGQSAGKPVRVVKTHPRAGENEVQALTGATVSSRSVSRIVNETIASLREPLLSMEGKDRKSGK